MALQVILGGFAVLMKFMVVCIRITEVLYEDILEDVHLTVNVFKGCPLTPLPPVSMAIRLTYVLQDWQQYFWPQQPPGGSFESI